MEYGSEETLTMMDSEMKSNAENCSDFSNKRLYEGVCGNEVKRMKKN